MKVHESPTNPVSRPAGWLSEYEERFEHDPDYVAESLALSIAEEAVQIMKSRSISRAPLASLMGVSKAYVTRLLNAPPNLTLRTLAQLALALGTRPYASLRGGRGAVGGDIAFAGEAPRLRHYDAVESEPKAR